MADNKAALAKLRATVKKLKTDGVKLKAKYDAKLKEIEGKAFHQGVMFALKEQAKFEKKSFQAWERSKKANEKSIEKKATKKVKVKTATKKKVTKKKVVKKKAAPKKVAKKVVKRATGAKRRGRPAKKK